MTAKDEVELLMQQGIGFGLGQLEQHGELYPYAMALNRNGEPAAVAVKHDTDQPTSQEVIESLVAVLAKGAASGEYKAIALFADVAATPPGGERTDAIRVSLEHKDGYCVDVYFPYQRGQGEPLKVGDLWADAREGQIFRP